MRHRYISYLAIVLLAGMVAHAEDCPKDFAAMEESRADSEASTLQNTIGNLWEKQSQTPPDQVRRWNSAVLSSLEAFKIAGHSKRIKLLRLSKF